MIKVKNLVPEVYYNHSRDFQLLGRLNEIVFNYLKTNVDSIYNIPLSQTSNNDLLELMSLTLGFKSKHNYPINQLRAICESFSEILKNKGNILSIQYTLNAMLRAEHIAEKAELIPNEDKHLIEIYIPASLKDINLFKDILEYILPAGFLCVISRHSLQELVLENINTTRDEIIGTIKASKETSYIPKHEDALPMDLSDIKAGRIDNSVILPYDNE